MALKGLDALIEARIRAAEHDGKLSGLAGAGKPLPRDAADDLPSDERFQVLLARSVGHVPEEVELLREIERLRAKLSAGDDTVRARLADCELRLTMLHEANGRNLSARRVGG
jgi:hypothetical protein